MAKIQIRRGTAEQWTEEGTFLSLGELGYETDTNRIKIGNLDDETGELATWPILKYFSYKDVVIQDVRNSILLDDLILHDGLDVQDIGRLVYDQESREVFVYDGDSWVSVSTGQVPTPTLNQVCREGSFTSTPIAAKDFLVSRGTPQLRGSVETEDFKLRSINNATDKFYGVTLKAPDLMRGILNSYELILPLESGETGELLMKGEDNSLIWASPFPYSQLKLKGAFDNEYDLVEAVGDDSTTGDLYLINKFYGFPFATKEEFDAAVGSGQLTPEPDILLLWVDGGSDGGGSWQSLGTFATAEGPQGPEGQQGPIGPQGPYTGDWNITDEYDQNNEFQSGYISGRKEYTDKVDSNFSTVSNNIGTTNDKVDTNRNDIINLQQELENALPSLNRATYNILPPAVSNSSTAGIGYTTSIDTSNNNATVMLPPYGDTTDVYLNAVDKFGVDQHWQTLLDDLEGLDDLLSRKYLLEIRNLDNESYGVFEILSDTSWSGGNATGASATINIKVKVLRSLGIPDTGTAATIKIYSTQSTEVADLDLRYLKKTGASSEISTVKTDFLNGLSVGTLLNVDVDEINARAVTKFVVDTPVISFLPPVEPMLVANRYITTRFNFANGQGLGIISEGYDTPLLRIFGTSDAGVETLGLDIKANGRTFWLNSPQLHQEIPEPTPIQIEEITAEFDLIENTQFVHKYYVDRSLQIYTEGRFFDLDADRNVINGNLNLKKVLSIQSAGDLGDTDALAITVVSGTGPISDVNTEITFSVDVSGDILTSGSQLFANAAHAKFKKVTTDSIILSKEPSDVSHAVTKRYVDNEFSRVKDNNYYVPVGSIMMWLASTPPKGWWFLSGNSFDVKLYPDLHNYLRDNVSTYKSGVMPNWDDQYFVQKGVNSGTDLGGKIGWKTAMPKGEKRIVIKEAGIPPAVYQVKAGPGAGHGSGANLLRPIGSTEAKQSEFLLTAKAGTGEGIHTHTYEGGDNVTRPDSVVGRYIMKGDFK